MYQNVPVTERVQRIRDKYRNTKPKIDLNRYKLVTEFYMENPDLTGILKRAYNLRNLFEHMPTPVNEDEQIVGFAAETYRGCALFPENSFWCSWTRSTICPPVRLTLTISIKKPMIIS